MCVCVFFTQIIAIAQASVNSPSDFSAIRLGQTDQSQPDINKQRQQDRREYVSREALPTVCRYAHVPRARFDLAGTPTSYVLPELFAVKPGRSCSAASK